MKNRKSISFILILISTSIFISACTSISKRQKDIADLLIGNIAQHRKDHAVVAKSFEKITREHNDKRLLSHCIESAVQITDFATAKKCIDRHRDLSIQELIASDKTILEQISNPSSRENKNSNVLDRLDIIEARAIAASYQGDYPAKFIKFIEEFSEKKQNSIITQTSRYLSRLNRYQRGVEIFNALVLHPNISKNINNQIFLADYLRSTWQDSESLLWAEKAFNEKATPISLIMYVEALHINGMLDKALAVLTKYQNKAEFADLVINTRISKIDSLDDENRLRDFLINIEPTILQNPQINPQTKLSFLGRWFELEDYPKTAQLQQKVAPSVYASKNPQLIGLLLYYQGITKLKLAKTDKEEIEARSILNRISQIPRYRRLIKIHDYQQQLEAEGNENFINNIDEQAKIIMSPDDYLALSHVLNQKNLTAKALEVIENGLVFHKNNSSMLYDAAMHAIALDIENKMENYLQRIIKVDPENFHAYNALGYTWADQNRNLAQAKINIEKALRHQPLEPVILDSYGWYYFRAGDYEKALEFLTRAINLQHDPEIAAHLIEVLLQIENSTFATGNERNQAVNIYDQAMKRYRQYPKKDSSIRAIKILNKIADKLNKPQTAINK